MSRSIDRARGRTVRDPARRPITGLMLASALLAGCADGASPAADAVARLGDRELSYSRFERYLETNLDVGEASEPVLEDTVASRLFDQFLNEQLLLSLANDRGYGTEEPLDQRTAVDHLLHGGLEQSIDPAEIAAYYEAHRARWERPRTAQDGPKCARCNTQTSE